MPHCYAMRDNGDGTYTIEDGETGAAIADRVDWSEADYLWHHLNAGVLAVHYTATGVRRERTDTDRIAGLNNGLTVQPSSGGGSGTSAPGVL